MHASVYASFFYPKDQGFAQAVRWFSTLLADVQIESRIFALFLVKLLSCPRVCNIGKPVELSGGLWFLVSGSRFCLVDDQNVQKHELTSFLMNQQSAQTLLGACC